MYCCPNLQLTDSENPLHKYGMGRQVLIETPGKGGRESGLLYILSSLWANSRMGLPEQLNMLKWRLSSPRRTSRGCYEIYSPKYSGKEPTHSSKLTNVGGWGGKGKMEILTAVIVKASGVRGVSCSGLGLSDSLVSAGLWLPSPGQVRRGFTDLGWKVPFIQGCWLQVHNGNHLARLPVDASEGNWGRWSGIKWL